MGQKEITVVSKRNQEGGVKYKLNESWEKRIQEFGEQSAGVRGVECFKCRKAGHRAKECAETDCYKYGKKGHIKRSCISKKKEIMQKRENRWKRKKI